MNSSTPFQRAPKLPSREDFLSQINEPFSAELAGADPGKFVLREVRSIVSTEEQENFTLTFVSDRTELPQSIYTLRNDVLGTMDIFLVPIALDANGLQLEAVFNHIHGR